LTKQKIQVKFRSLMFFAEVAELADALGSGLSEHYAREGSSPSFGTGTLPALIYAGFLFPLREQTGWSKMEL
jgi:hypothetical protein